MVWNIVVTVFFSVVAWFATHFFARYILKVYEYREKAHELIAYTANVGALNSEKITAEEKRRIEDASDQLWRLAAQTAALSAAMPIHCKRFVSCCLAFSITDAAAGLRGLSNSFVTKDGSRKTNREIIEKAFRLPPIS